MLARHIADEEPKTLVFRLWITLKERSKQNQELMSQPNFKQKYMTVLAVAQVSCRCLRFRHKFMPIE